MMQECKTLIPKATRGWIRLQDNASCCSRSWIWWCLRRYAVKQLLCAAFASVSFQRHDVPSIFCQQMQEVFQDWNCTDLWPTKGNLTLLYVLIISTLDSAHRKHTRFDNPVLNQVPARLFRLPHWFILLSSPAALWRWWQISTQKASYGQLHIFHGAKSSGMPSVLSDLDSKFSDHSSFEDACPTASRGTNRNFLQIVRWVSTLNGPSPKSVWLAWLSLPTCLAAQASNAHFSPAFCIRTGGLSRSHSVHIATLASKERPDVL